MRRFISDGAAVTSNQPCRMPEERKRLRYSPGVSRRTRVKMAAKLQDHPHAGGENSRDEQEHTVDMIGCKAEGVKAQ